MSVGRETWSDAISGLDPRYLAEAESAKKTGKKPAVLRILAAAAALLVLAAVGGFIWNAPFIMMLVRGENGLRLAISYPGTVGLDQNEDGLVILNVSSRLALFPMKVQAAEDELTAYQIDLSLEKEVAQRDLVWETLTKDTELDKMMKFLSDREIVRPFVPDGVVIGEVGISEQICYIQYTANADNEENAVMYITAYHRDSTIEKTARALKGDIVYVSYSDREEIDSFSIRERAMETYYY